MATAEQAAVEHAECPISFEPLNQHPVAVFLDAQGRRCSPHYYNAAAAEQWLAHNSSCPCTRSSCASVMRVPSPLDDPRAWFTACDVDGDGRLSRAEVIEALCAFLPVDVRQLSRDARANGPGTLWSQWDTHGRGWLELEDVLGPEHRGVGGATASAGQGVIDHIRSHYCDTGGGGVHAMAGCTGGAPALNEDEASKRRWFEHWDEDGSGALERGELVRALIKTLALGQSVTAKRTIADTLNALWCLFDDDNSGAIDMEEFLRPNTGLADAVLAQLRSGSAPTHA